MDLEPVRLCGVRQLSTRVRVVWVTAGGELVTESGIFYFLCAGAFQDGARRKVVGVVDGGPARSQFDAPDEGRKPCGEVLDCVLCQEEVGVGGEPAYLLVRWEVVGLLAGGFPVHVVEAVADASW